MRAVTFLNGVVFWYTHLVHLERRWRNWQTHQLEVLAPKGIGVQVPSSAPELLPGQPGETRKAA